MTILATIVVLGVLIFVHELGHFGAAKAVGIRVERFSIGLGPRVAGFRIGETDYVLSAVPLGGYVKMGGMDDEVMERVEGGAPEAPREPSHRDFDAKPVWARALVISAGVVMNMLFAFLAYTAVAGVWGFRQISTDRVGEIRAETLPAGAEALAEVPEGARFLSVGSREVENWGDVTGAFLDGPAGPVEVTTAEPAMSVTIRVPEDDEGRLRLAASLSSWVEPRVGFVNPGSPAEAAGLEAGDEVLSVAGTPVSNWHDIVRAVQDRPGLETEFVLRRGGGEVIRYVTPDAAVETDPATGERREVGRIGILIPNQAWEYQRVGPAEAVVYGWRETVAATTLILDFLRDLFTGGVSPRSVGSIVTIGQASGQAAAAGLDTFLSFMALFSVNLAILNLLPIPVLDGGHLVFLLIEAVRGRALSAEQRLRWSNVGLLVVMGLMVWALGNDILRVFGL